MFIHGWRVRGHGGKEQKSFSIMRQSEIVVYGKWSSQSYYLVQGPGNKAINGMRNALQDAKGGPSETEGTQCPKGSDSNDSPSTDDDFTYILH